MQCFQDKNMSILKLLRHAQSFYSSRDHTRPLRLPFGLAMVLTMYARRFQRTFLLSEMGTALKAPKDIAVGVTHFAPIVSQDQ